MMNETLCHYVVLLISSLGILFLEAMSNMIDPKKDPLRKKIGIHTDLDGWSIAHFTLYIILGMLFPNRYLFFFVMSVFWEGMEHETGKRDVYFFDKKILNKGQMYGKVSDVAVNMAGYILGTYYVSGILNMNTFMKELI